LSNEQVSAAVPSIPIGPRVRKSPFFAATRRWGCKCYSVYNHMFMPVYYQSPEADFWKLVEAVTLWDVAVERQVEISGPDAARFTQLLTPRNLSKCAVGQCKYVLITDEHGGIINDPVLLKLAEDRFWLSLADADVLLWAKGLAHGAGMDVTIVEPDVSPLQVQGPHSPEVMRALFGEWIDDLRYFWFRETELDGIPVLVSRTGWSSERGYEIFLRDGTCGDELWERIMAAGQPWGIAPGAPSAIRRIEGAMLSHGSDMTLAENPYELGLGRLVDLDQEAEFVGKDALRRIAAEGVRRAMVGVEVEGASVGAGNEHPWPVVGGEALAARLTSCVWSPRLKKNIGLALVASADAAVGTEITLATPTGERRARVVPIPFYDPKKKLASG